MKMFLLTLLCLFCMGTVALAADVKLSWDPVDGATGYKIFQSLDVGQTWTQVADVTNGSTVETTLTGEPDSGLILYRASAYNENEEALRTEAGAWYNGDWMPLQNPGGTGIE
jgi:opacity protein-like surface antigen